MKKTVEVLGKAIMEDNEGRLHFLLKEVVYTEDKGSTIKDLITIDLPLEKDAKPEYFIVRMKQDKVPEYLGKPRW